MAKWIDLERTRLAGGQRYVRLHQCFFFASFLDPRAFPMLKEDATTNTDYEQLKKDIVDQIIAKSKAMSMKNKSSNQGQDNPPATTSLPCSTKAKSKKHSKASQMLRALNAKPKASTDEIADNNDELRNDCMSQLNLCIKDELTGLELSKTMINYTVIYWSDGRMMW